MYSHPPPHKVHGSAGVACSAVAGTFALATLALALALTDPGSSSATSAAAAMPGAPATACRPPAAGTVASMSPERVHDRDGHTEEGWGSIAQRAEPCALAAQRPAEDRRRLFEERRRRFRERGGA